MNDETVNILSKDDSGRIKFFEKFKISESTWGSAKIDWCELVDIVNDHRSNFNSLAANAAMYAGIIQGISGVHSVRWRVKDPEHLAEKIIRKKADNKEQYKEINKDNYYDIVTDLVGIRALHLFKDDFKVIHEKLSPLLHDKEIPVANIREGDNESFSDLCRELGFEVNEHSAGYRSIHYVKTVKPFNRDLHIEIQVRTVFEEGWSEVDHQVRYPNFSNDPLVLYASLILNRLSGMADEMSTYAKQLVAELDKKSEALKEYQNSNDAALERIEQLLAELDETRQDHAMQQQSLSKLKQELNQMKATSTAEKNISKALLHLSSNNSLGALPDVSLDINKYIKNIPVVRLTNKKPEEK